MTTPQHRADLFLDPGSDPREGGPRLSDERTTLNEFLRCQRLTLQLKCDGLDAEQLARRAVEPSTMSLLGLVRHMAEVERAWFRRRFAGHDVPRRYQTEADPDADFNGAAAGQAVAGEAWAAWREEIAFAGQFTRDHDLGFVGRDSEGEPVSLRELLVHMIEEYARHNGHADLLRERIDGRVGQLCTRQIQTLAIRLLRLRTPGMTVAQLALRDRHQLRQGAHRRRYARLGSAGPADEIGVTSHASPSISKREPPGHCPASSAGRTCPSCRWGVASESGRCSRLTCV